MEKEKKFMIIGVFILLITLVGAAGTYAWFTWSSTNNTNLTMSIGASSDVVFKNGNDISTNKLAPVFNYTDGEKTTFTITNKSTTSFSYRILLNITSIDNELKNKTLKYKLVSNNTIITEGDFSNIESNSKNTLYEGELSKGNVGFIFYLYINGNEENSLSMIGKSLSGTITVEEKPTLAKTITNLYSNATKTTATVNSVTYNLASSVGLMNDRNGSSSVGADAGNIRYYGASPNNYIYFNCSDYNNQSSSTCETWRIIGVFDGKVKIMRGSQIGTYSWDNKNADTGAETAYGKNDWTTARLMKLLNPNDYYTIDSNDSGNGQSLYWNASSGTCFSGKNNATTSCDFTSIGLKNDTTRNLIAETTYTIKGHDNNQVYVDVMYDKERVSGTVYTGRPTSWTGKIAVAYPSDYGYAADLSLCQKTLFDYDNGTCTANNWMKNIVTNNGANIGWLLTPSSGYAYFAWYVHSVGNVNNYLNAYTALGVAPVLSLNSELDVGAGTGTSSSPYQLSV